MRSKRIWQSMAVVLALTAAVGAQAKSKGLKNMVLHLDATVAGTPLAAGSYNVQWQTHSPEATVTFLKAGKVAGTAEGKLVDRGYKYPSDQVMYDTAPDGTHHILEIRFKGSSEVLQFN